MITLAEARALMPAADGRTVVTHADGSNRNIQEQVIAAYRDSHEQARELAARLKGRTPVESARNIWQFVRYQVRYQLDPPGYQYLPTPVRTIQQGFADCKGKSILVASLLAALGIAPTIRFASYTKGTPVSHVYVVTKIGGATYVLDACLNAFNREQPYQHKKDYMMTIARISGPDEGHEVEVEISGLEPEHIQELKLARNGIALEREIVRNIAGIGSPGYNSLTQALRDYDAALANPTPEAIAGVAAQMEARLWARRRGLKRAPGKAFAARPWHRIREERRIGFFKKIAKKAKQAVKKAGSTTGKGLQKAGSATGKGLQKAVKATAKAAVKTAQAARQAATYPLRVLFAQLIPKLGPSFLYLHITNAKTIASLPAKVKRKRAKQYKFMKFITRVSRMSEATFLKHTRNGIMKKYKRTPEQVLSGMVKGPINGIGIIPIALAAAEPETQGLLTQLLGVVSKLFGKKPSADEQMGADDAPSADDFAEATPRQKRLLRGNMASKTATERGEEPNTNLDEQLELQQQDQVMTALENEPEDTPEEAPLPDTDGSTDYADEPDEPDFKTPAPVAPGGGGPTTPAAPAINPMVLVGGAALVAMAAMSGGRQTQTA